jgi:hypothetical protein
MYQFSSLTTVFASRATEGVAGCAVGLRLRGGASRDGSKAVRARMRAGHARVGAQRRVERDMRPLCSGAMLRGDWIVSPTVDPPSQ